MLEPRRNANHFFGIEGKLIAKSGWLIVIAGPEGMEFARQLVAQQYLLSSHLEEAIYWPGSPVRDPNYLNQILVARGLHPFECTTFGEVFSENDGICNFTDMYGFMYEGGSAFVTTGQMVTYGWNPRYER